jgi:peroxiredoxin
VHTDNNDAMTRCPRTLQRALVFALLATLFTLTAGATDTTPQFRDFAGKPQSIDAYRSPGQWLVLMIWASDCHVCNMEAEAYAHLHEEQKDRNLRLLGLSIDGADVAAARDFVSNHDLPFPSLIGDVAAVAQYYTRVSGRAFMGTPSFVIFRPDGTAAASQAGAVPPEVITEYVDSQSGPTR